jgi:hypothetical protein
MSVSSSDDLARTRVLFEQWRATRQGRSKIPEELWQAAVALHGRYSASQLCRELRLSAGALRSHLQKAMPETASSRPAFVPLQAEPLGWPAPALPTAAAAEIRLVWERADGTRLHLYLPASHVAQVISLCTTFSRS